MKKDGNKKITPAFLILLAISLAILLWPVCRYTEAVFGAFAARALLFVLTVLGTATMVSYMLPVSKVRSVLHGIGEFFYPMFLTALPLLLVTDVLYYFLRAAVAPATVLLVLAAVFLTLAIIGLVQGLGLRVRRYEAAVKGAKPFRIVLLSDLHLGYFTPASLGKGLTEAILKESPDLVIHAGDLFDDRFDSLSASGRGQIRADLAALSSSVPVWACEGNHDLLCSDPRKEAFIKSCGIQTFYDESAVFKGTRIVFRRDVANEARRDIKDLFNNDGTPTIVVDHNPFSHKEAWENGASLVLSGHTHGGQTFPGTLLYKTGRLGGYGLLRAGDKQLIVTSGAGIYGCPIRLGAAREIVTIDIFPS